MSGGCAFARSGDLPILGRHSLLRPTWAEALAEAEARIDSVLSI